MKKSKILAELKKKGEQQKHSGKNETQWNSVRCGNDAAPGQILGALMSVELGVVCANAAPP